MAIIHRFGATVEDLDKPIPSLDPAGFDTVSRSILYRGTFQQLLTEFSLGSTLSGLPQMYCTGPQGGSRSRFGHIWATIGYKGFASENSRKQISSWSVTTRETQLPIDYSRPNGTKYTVYASPPMVPQVVNPKTGTYYRVRLIDRIYGATMQGVTIGSPTSGPSIPTFTGQPPTGGINWETLYDPTLNYPYGWSIRDHQVTSQFTAGEKSLYFWTARFEYVDRYGP